MSLCSSAISFKLKKSLCSSTISFKLKQVIFDNCCNKHYFLLVSIRQLNIEEDKNICFTNLTKKQVLLISKKQVFLISKKQVFLISKKQLLLISKTTSFTNLGQKHFFSHHGWGNWRCPLVKTEGRNVKCFDWKFHQFETFCQNSTRNHWKPSAQTKTIGREV